MTVWFYTCYIISLYYWSRAYRYASTWSKVEYMHTHAHTHTQIFSYSSMPQNPLQYGETKPHSIYSRPVRRSYTASNLIDRLSKPLGTLENHNASHNYSLKTKYRSLIQAFSTIATHQRKINIHALLISANNRQLLEGSIIGTSTSTIASFFSVNLYGVIRNTTWLKVIRVN